MNRMLLALVLTVAIPAIALSQTTAKMASSDSNEEQMFRQLERQMFDATQGKADLAAFDRIWADDFFSINHDGSTVDKQQTLAFLRTGKFLAEKITSDEFRLRRYGDSAVITGRSTYFVGGQKVGDVRHTQVWIKRNGRWQLVGWQGTPIQDPPK
jgi:hypothetical protein